jgi:outer membrane protein insertion porin family
MTPHPWCRLLLTSILGLLLAQGRVASAQNADPADKQQIIETIRFEGVKGLNEEELRANLGLKVKGAYDEDALKSDKRIIERSLQDQGYPFAKIQKVSGKLGPAGHLILAFVIDSGDLYHIAEVKLTGNEAFKSRELAPKTHVTAGKIYSGSDIDADIKMIYAFYGDRGYADATLEVQMRALGKGSARITYDITEGKKSLLQAIQISGNAKVKEEDIRKEFKLASGDVFNTVLIEQGRQALLKTGLFETVEVSTLEAKPGYKNLEVTVVEK